MVKRFLLPVFVAVLLAVLGNSCHEDPVEPEPTPEPTVEGIYLGVIGFNDQLYVKDISLLNASTYTVFTNFIDNLTPHNNTALLYADYTALQKMNEYPSPPKLKNVALVTFTDGLDNASTTLSGYNGSTSAYRDALHQKIMNERIHGLNVSAYSIGLKGADVSDEAQFMETLRKLASSDNNVFQVANMDEAMARFSEIAASLYSTSTSVNLGVSVPGSIVEDGQHIRFTFDNVDAATNSTRYIEAAFRYTSNSNRTLDNITYHGFAQGPTTIVSSASQGVSFQFQFENLTYADGNPVPQSDMNNIKLWKQTSTGAWDKETEFSPASSTTITEEKNSALIVLVLDCTTSLGSDFTHMQGSAKQFVRTLANVDGGGGSGGGSNSDGTIVHHAVTDVDGNSYDAVWIGNQLWMNKNLRTKHYADGTSISHGSSPSTTTAYYYYPDNNSGNVSTYGLLYNWKAVMHNSSSSSAHPSGVQGICPNGWHVPSDAEWTQLENYVSSQNQYICSSSDKIAKALASTTGWDNSSEACAIGNNQSSNNATGFGALPAGYYYGNGYYYSGYDAYFWSATEASSDRAWSRGLYYNGASVNRYSGNKNSGYSVRCLRD